MVPGQGLRLGHRSYVNPFKKLEMQEVKTKSNGLTKKHVAAFGQIMKLRQESQDLIDYAWRFYREDWTELLQCAHCVSDTYTTTEINKQRLRELVDKEQQVLDGLRQLVAVTTELTT